MQHNVHSDFTANALMVAGTVLSCSLAAVEWIDAHSGFFVAVAAMGSFGISIWGAARAVDKRRKS